MLFFAGRAAEGAAILRRAQERLPAGEPAREQLEVALLGVSYTSASARREADATIAALRDPGGPARDVLQATTLATLAMDEVMYLRSAATAIDLAERALAAGLPLEPHRGENWAILALAALAVADDLDAALRGADEILARGARAGRGADGRDHLGAARADRACAAATWPPPRRTRRRRSSSRPTCSAPSSSSWRCRRRCSPGLERDETPDSLRRLIDRAGIRYDTEFTPSSQLRYASGVLRAAAGNHEAAVEELRGCELDHPAFGGENPAVLAWRSAAALSLAELGRHDEARALAADEVRRAQSFGAPRAIGIALRAQALVGPPAERSDAARRRRSRCWRPRRRGSSTRACWSTSAPRSAPPASAPRPASRCSRGSRWPPAAARRALERRARAELAAIGVRPRDHRPHRRGLADAQRAARGRARRGRRHQPRDRPDAVRHREDRRDAPRTRLPQARRLVAAAASRRARARLAPPSQSGLFNAHTNTFNRSTVELSAGPAARILSSSRNATDGALCATRR